jgi:NADPH-dependent 2,4-dienoyl-CoA reductase/sulfur reductase-like enzyme
MRRRDFLRGGALAAAAWRAHASRVTAAPHVLIAGGGFAGACCALQLRRLSPAIRVTLIDPRLRYVTCPMSNEVLVGLRTLPAITTTRAGLRRAGVHCVRDRVAAIDADRRRVRLEGGGALGYDRLVIAPGIRFLFGHPEGYTESAALRMPHAWQAGEQTDLLARQLRAVADGATIAISVPAGLMRCPPGPYERASLIAYWLKRHRTRCKVLVFDSNNHFPRQDVFSAAWEELYPRMIEWIAPADGGAVTRVDVPSSTLYSSSGAHRVAVANIIPPQAPGSLAHAAGLATEHGWCPIKPASFESQLVDGIYVIGDACIAGAMPKAASAAQSQAQHCAAAIAASFQAQPPASADFDSVCYSLLAPGTAFAIHGQFTLRDGEIRASEVADAARPDAQQASAAAQWYAQIRTACFDD